MPYNLQSPNALLEPIELSNVEQWFVRETTQIESEAVRQVLHHVATHLPDFVEWPKRAVLLWEGCDRCKPEDKKQKYHTYPQAIRTLAKQKNINLDSRPNGPAIAAFMFAGGVRLRRFGSTNATTMHHVYSGKFPYINRANTTHAAKLGKHFSQSAGVIATHPVADALCDEYPFFTWLLRYESFRRFGYDPDGAFSSQQDALGFAEGHGCEVMFGAALAI